MPFQRKIEIYGYTVSIYQSWLEQNKLLVNLLGRSFLRLLFLETSSATLDTTTAAAPTNFRRSTPASSITALRKLRHLHFHPIFFTCCRPGPPLDQPRWTYLNCSTTSPHSGHLSTLLEDGLGIGRLDGPPAATPAPPRTPFALHALCLHPLAATRLYRQLLLGRTQVIRRTDYGMAERNIILTMTEQTGIPGHRIFGSVLHDPRDRRRFYLTYATMTVTRDVMGRVFLLGGIHIRPTGDDIEGNLPYRHSTVTNRHWTEF